MHSTFLEELDKFIKGGNLFRGSYNRIYISNKFLPVSFRREVVSRAKGVNSQVELDPSFILLYDDSNNHLCMLFTFSNGTTNILLKDTPDHIFIREKYTPFDLDDVILDASKRDVRSDLYYAAVDGLKATYSYSDTDARREAAIKIDEVLQGFTDKDFLEGAKISESLDRILPIIEEYALYISELYKVNVEHPDSEVEVLPSIIPLMANVVYKQIKSHRSHLDDQTRIGSVALRERINEVIDYNKRQQLLKSLNPIAEGSCLNQDDDEIDYYVFLYKVGENEYKFVFEPLSGKKCTKVVNFKYDKELTIDVIEELAMKYLSMSEEEIIESTYAARFNHTSEETYNMVIPYAITGDAEKYPCPYGTKARIDQLDYDESELEQKSIL